MSAVLHNDHTHGHDDHHGAPAGWRRWVYATNHKDIGTLYMLFSFAMLMIGGILALLIRTELFQPGLQVVNPELFNQLTTMHGLIMVFGAIMPAFVGFANWMIPLQIGASDMAFARMNNFSFWLMIPAAIMLISTFFMQGGAPAAGWTLYAPLTLHESGLSPCIHSIMAAQLGEKDLAVAMYKRTARYDLDNINQDSQDGLHITSMSGSWLAIAKGFAGMRTLGGLRFKPFLPDCWNGYSYKFNYRGRIIELRVKPKGVTLTLISGEPISVTIYGHPYELEDVLTVPLEG